MKSLEYIARTTTHQYEPLKIKTESTELSNEMECTTILIPIINISKIPLNLNTRSNLNFLTHLCDRTNFVVGNIILRMKK